MTNHISNAEEAHVHTSQTVSNRRPGRLLSLFLTAVLVVTAGITTATTANAAMGKPSVGTVGSTAVQMKWTAFSGATEYELQSATNSGFTSSVKSVKTTKTNAVTSGLTTGKTYYFRVRPKVDGTYQGWSGHTTGVPKNSYTTPVGLQASNVAGTSVELTWSAISGAPGFLVRATASGHATRYAYSLGSGVIVKGLDKGTTYSFKVYVNQPPVPEDNLPDLQMSNWSSGLSVKTSTYSIAAPPRLRVTGQDAYEVKFAWDRPTGMNDSYSYQMQYASTSAMTDAKWGPKWPGTSTEQSLKGLSSNRNYFVRIRVVDSDGAQKSDRSDYIMAKTLTPTGTIAGKISGAPTGDVVVSAYNSAKEMVQQVNVRSDGSYKLKVRPGTYKVQAAYIGSGSYVSYWAKSDSGGVQVPSWASVLTVSRDATTNAPPVKLREGAQIKGKVTAPDGKPIRSVDVTALSAMNDEREVMALTHTETDGTFTLRGLSNGHYWLRMIYSGDGFKTRSIWINVQDGKLSEYRLSTWAQPRKADHINTTLDLDSFRKSYGAYVSGTKRKGSTLTGRATPWLAGSYPTTRATMKMEWRRDGKTIKTSTCYTSGATENCYTKYKLTSSDRGHRISLKVTAYRYGYRTGVAYSKSYRVS